MGRAPPTRPTSGRGALTGANRAIEDGAKKALFSALGAETRIPVAERPGLELPAAGVIPNRGMVSELGAGCRTILWLDE